MGCKQSKNEAEPAPATASDGGAAADAPSVKAEVEEKAEASEPMIADVTPPEAAPAAQEEAWKGIHSAVRWGKPTSEVEALVEKVEGGVDIKDPGNGNCPIHIASQNGHLELTKFLILKGADVNGTNNKGNTGLHMAIGYDYYAVAQALLDAGADGEAKNENGFVANRGIDGDKNLGVARLMDASSPEDVVAAFDLCESDLEGTKAAKIPFVQAGMKIKKALAAKDQWSDDLQGRFKALSSKVL